MSGQGVDDNLRKRDRSWSVSLILYRPELRDALLAAPQKLAVNQEVFAQPINAVVRYGQSL